MLEIRRNLKKIQKLEEKKKLQKNKVPKKLHQIDFPVITFLENHYKRKSTSDISEGSSELKTDVFRTQETKELKIKYLLRPQVDRHE